MTDLSQYYFIQKGLADYLPAYHLTVPLQPEYTPPGLKTLLQAFQEIGRDQFGESWTGDELVGISTAVAAKAAPDLERQISQAPILREIAIRKAEEHREMITSTMAFSSIMNNRPPPNPEKETSKSRETVYDMKVSQIDASVASAKEMLSFIRCPDDDACKRRDAAWKKLRDWISVGTLPLYVRPAGGGKPVPVNRESWGTGRDYEHFNEGLATLKGPITGWLVVQDDELARALLGKAETKAPSNEPSAPDATPPAEHTDRKRDVGEEAKLRNRIETVITEARRKWPNPKEAPSFRDMAKALVHGKPGRQFEDYKDSSIRKILEGRYLPAKRLKISGL